MCVHTLFFLSFCLFKAVPVAYGGSWARGLIVGVHAIPQPQQHQIWALYVRLACSNAGSFNLLNKARDWTCILMDTSQVLNWLSLNGNSRIFFHYGLLQDIEYSFLSYTVGPWCLSILYIIVCNYLFTPPWYAFPDMPGHAQLMATPDLYPTDRGQGCNPNSHGC